MQYSDTSTNQGILQELESILFSDNYGYITGNTARLQTFTRHCNEALNEVTSLILSADTRWQFDDTNYTDFPIGIADLFSGQQDYTFDVTHLKITKVLVKDQNGEWFPIRPIDQSDQGVRGYLVNDSDNTGVPHRYDKLGSSILLDPVPNYNSTGGLKVYFQRPPSVFSTSDTTKTPGIPSIFHRYIPLRAALFYGINNTVTNKKDLADEVERMKASIVEFYSKRDKDDVSKLTPHYESSR